MRLAWLTDIHLDFLPEHERLEFLETVAAQADAVAITGDISESPSIIDILKEMESVLQVPIYFVLGNHDFYRGSIAQTRNEVASLSEQSEFLTYLTANSVVALSAENRSHRARWLGGRTARRFRVVNGVAQ